MFDVKIDFDSEQFTRSMKEAVATDLRGKLESSVATVTCPTHHEHPTIVDSGGELEDRFSISACCDEAAELARRAIEM